VKEDEMRFLCLAYGAEKDWLDLSQGEQDELLAQDEVLRRRGDLVAVLESPVTLRAWDGTPVTTEGALPGKELPLAGFSLIEARDLDEAVALTKDTPCARAKGAVELWPLRES
jgi:hypothetical protein